MVGCFVSLLMLNALCIADGIVRLLVGTVDGWVAMYGLTLRIGGDGEPDIYIHPCICMYVGIEDTEIESQFSILFNNFYRSIRLLAHSLRTSDIYLGIFC